MAIDDGDLIDPDPEARRSTLGASAWLDHCREADAFLLDALKVLDGDQSSAKVSAARKKETERDAGEDGERRPRGVRQAVR
jgi:hypothetical protein